ncbi:MAG: HAD family hydrolase [Chloroflexota bacterium]|nr:MAG: hypothetical protein DIU68_08405 [Chloroflexota bacterium]
MLKAVVFDLDDTLIDWSGVNDDWERRQARQLEGVIALIRERHALEDAQAYVEAFRSRSRRAWEMAREDLRAPNMARDLVQAALALGVPEHVLDERLCMEAYRWGTVEGCGPFPEVIEMLQHLRDQGLKLGLITNAYQPMWARDIELEAYGLLPFFEECRFSAADVGYLKPHPSIFKVALECLGTAPEETVFVGDDIEADIGGAKAAGLYAVLRTSYRRPQVLNGDIQPDSIIHSLLELPEVLDKAFPGWSR